MHEAEFDRLISHIDNMISSIKKKLDKLKDITSIIF